MLNIAEWLWTPRDEAVGGPGWRIVLRPWPVPDPSPSSRTTTTAVVRPPEPPPAADGRTEGSGGRRSALATARSSERKLIHQPTQNCAWPPGSSSPWSVLCTAPLGTRRGLRQPAIGTASGAKCSPPWMGASGRRCRSTGERRVRPPLAASARSSYNAATVHGVCSSGQGGHRRCPSG